MGMRAAEHVVRTRRFGPKLRLRVDLHGVSVFGAGEQRTLIRWEWMEAITPGDGVTIRSASAELKLPAGAFGLSAAALCDRLLAARSLDKRSEVIAQLAAAGGSS